MSLSNGHLFSLSNELGHRKWAAGCARDDDSTEKEGKREIAIARVRWMDGLIKKGKKKLKKRASKKKNKIT